MSSTSSPQEWLVLQCLACGASMKVRAGTAPDARVACPVCRSPVAVQRSTPDFKPGPEFRGAVPARSGGALAAPGPAEPGVHEEFAPTPGNQGLFEDRRGVESQEGEEPEGHFLDKVVKGRKREDGKQAKIKKRRVKWGLENRNDLTDWDTVAHTLPEAEVLADTWLAPVPIPEDVVPDHEAESVTEERGADGKIRRTRKVKKRAVFQLAQLFFRRLSFGMRIFTVAMVTAIAAGGIWYGIMVFRQKFVPVTFDDVAADFRPDRRYLGRQDELDASTAVTAFLAAEGVEQKLPWVRLPNRVRPLMEAWYRDHPDRALKTGQVINRDKFLLDGAFFVKLEIEIHAGDRLPENAEDGASRTAFFLVEEFEKEGTRTYKVDWETYGNRQPLQFAAFRESQSTVPTPFRVKVRESTYYNHGFLDEKRWLAAELSFPQPQSSGFMCYGYIDRYSPVWQDLLAFTEGVSNPALIVNLRYPENGVSRDQVIIDSVVRQSWMYFDDVPPGEKANTATGGSPAGEGGARPTSP